MKKFAVTNRRVGGLIRFWLAGLVIAAGLYWLGRTVPAARDLLLPGYWILGGLAVLFTARWYQPRRGDRRQGDRRDH